MHSRFVRWMCIFMALLMVIGLIFTIVASIASAL